MTPHVTAEDDVRRFEAVLSLVEFPGYRFFVAQGHGGIYLRASYEEPDVYSKVVSVQLTRKWLLSPLMTDSEVVLTAFKCAATSFEHRARENFTYRGARVCGPHFDVEDLVRLCKSGRENAGGRKGNDP